MQGRLAAVAAFLLLGACVAQEKPVTVGSTVAPSTVASSGDLVLPPPDAARRSEGRASRGLAGVRLSSALALPPEIGDRPELPKSVAVEPPKTVAAPPPPPSPAPPLARPPTPVAPVPVASAPIVSPPVAPAPVASTPVERASSTQTAAPAPVEPVAPPSGPPLVAVHFATGSAELSDGARLVLELFARDPATQHLRQIVLSAWAGDEDPVEARKIAFACALSVHAYLIDQGLKAKIDIGGFGPARENEPNRVELRAGP